MKLSPFEVAYRLRCSRREVYDAASRGLLPFKREGRRLYMDEETLHSLMRRRDAIMRGISAAIVAARLDPPPP